MAPVGCQTHRHATCEIITKYDHPIHQKYKITSLTVPHHMSCKNKLNASNSLILVESFTLLSWVEEEPFLHTHHKPQKK
jgi:hypothetical protein